MADPARRALLEGVRPARRTGSAVPDVVAPSGGHALVAVQGAAVSADDMTAVDVRAAAKDEPAELAWTYQELVPQTADSWRVGGPFTVGLAGPPAAVRAVVTTASGTLEVPLADGVGWVQVEGAQAVAFLDEGGTTLAGASVSRPDRVASLGPVVTGG